VDTKKEITNLASQKGVHDVRQNRDEITFQVDNENLGSVIAYLSQFEIVNLRSTPPSLEELFMTHYKSEVVSS